MIVSTYLANPQPAINYPDGAPDFKQFRGMNDMENSIVSANSPEQNRFTTISDFKTCISLKYEKKKCIKKYIV